MEPSNLNSEISDDIPIELLQKGVRINDQEVIEHDQLTLEEIEGHLLQGQNILINARGINSSLRNAEDGIVFFGTEDKTENNCVNDFILNVDSDIKKSLKSPHVFKIYYRRDTQKFYLSTVEENKEIFFIFVLLEKPEALIGEHVIVSVLSYNFKIFVDPNSKEITIEYGNNEQHLSKSNFKPEKKNILIGRKAECDIMINDTGFSREQATIFFDEAKSNWFIKDGGKESVSKSGTWYVMIINTSGYM